MTRQQIAEYASSRSEIVHHYRVVNHPTVNDAGENIDHYAIEAVDADGLVIANTGLEYYSHRYVGRPLSMAACQNSHPGRETLGYITKALNAIINGNKIASCREITAKMIVAHLDAYVNTPIAHSHEQYPSEQSVKKCVAAVSHFFANLAADRLINASPEELVAPIPADKGKIYQPVFARRSRHSPGHQLIRDISLKLAQRLVELAYEHDPMIAFAIVLGISAGLRAGEVLCLRQDLSPVSARKGIGVSMVGDRVTGISIDLSREFRLRDDGIVTGRIKKERTVKVFPDFRQEVVDAYERHKQVLARTKQLDPQLPMFVNIHGHAMTYQTYLQRLQKLVNQFLVPELEASTDPYEVTLAHKLRAGGSLGTHVFRHVFTLRLTARTDNPAVVQHFRGDKSPDSALAYLAGKQELMDQLHGTHRDVLDALGDGGAKAYGQQD